MFGPLTVGTGDPGSGSPDICLVVHDEARDPRDAVSPQMMKLEAIERQELLKEGGLREAPTPSPDAR